MALYVVGERLRAGAQAGRSPIERPLIALRLTPTNDGKDGKPGTYRGDLHENGSPVGYVFNFKKDGDRLNFDAWEGPDHKTLAHYFLIVTGAPGTYEGTWDIDSRHHGRVWCIVHEVAGEFTSESTQRWVESVRKTA